MSYSRTWGQGFGSPGYASMEADPDIMAQGLQQRLAQGAQSDAEMKRLQAQIAAQQASQAAQQAFQGQEAANQRTFSGQMLEAQGRINHDAAAQNFGYTSQLADKQNAATTARDAALSGYQRELAGDQFGYNTKLAEQNNAFQRTMLGLQQGGQRQLSAQEAQQQLQRDAAQFGYTEKLNQGQYTQQQLLQSNDLKSRMELAKLQDSGETGRLGMSLAGDRYRVDQQTALGREGLASQERIAAGPLEFARQKFAATMPLLQQAMAGGGGGGYFDPGTVKGSTTAPTSVYSAGEIAQQVNAQMASNARRTGGAATDLRESAAARGLSSTSAALQGQLQGLDVARMGEDAVAAREIPFQAAKANADQATAAAALVEQSRGANLNAMINQRQIAAGQKNAMIAALAGII